MHSVAVFACFVDLLMLMCSFCFANQSHPLTCCWLVAKLTVKSPRCCAINGIVDASRLLLLPAAASASASDFLGATTASEPGHSSCPTPSAAVAVLRPVPGKAAAIIGAARATMLSARGTPGTLLLLPPRVSLATANPASDVLPDAAMTLGFCCSCVEHTGGGLNLIVTSTDSPGGSSIRPGS